MQEKLLRKLHREFATAPPRTAPRVQNPPAADRQRGAALSQLVNALARSDDAGTIAACRTLKNTAGAGLHIDTNGIACMENLSAWLGSSQNTSSFRTLTALMYSRNPGDVKNAIQPFVALQAQSQVSMQDRVLGAVQRLRAQVGPAAPGAPIDPHAAAGLRRMEMACFERDPRAALDAYKAMVPGDDRPQGEIERDVKDLRKLTRHWLATDSNHSSINSLNAIVGSPDLAAIQRVIGHFADGNSTQAAAQDLVSGTVEKLRRLSREGLIRNRDAGAASTSGAPPAPPEQGRKRHATEEAGESSAAGARRRVDFAVPMETSPTQLALDAALHEELEAILASGEPPPRLP